MTDYYLHYKPKKSDKTLCGKEFVAYATKFSQLPYINCPTCRDIVFSRLVDLLEYLDSDEFEAEVEE